MPAMVIAAIFALCDGRRGRVFLMVSMFISFHQM
jgi:hypothetical protein